MSSRTVVLVIGVHVAEKLGDVHARSVGEVLRLDAEGRGIGADVAADQVRERF
ncbi:hypothetical protein [Mycobacterium marinum]|uniref:hypothetical protein n=1 Tax=Mycobacterium marinum TaxID=1781 RepID=UPI0035649DCA